METHFMLAALSWWEISGVRPVFVGEKMEKWNGERVETAEPPSGGFVVLLNASTVDR